MEAEIEIEMPKAVKSPMLGKCSNLTTTAMASNDGERIWLAQHIVTSLCKSGGPTTRKTAQQLGALHSCRGPLTSAFLPPCHLVSLGWSW